MKIGSLFSGIGGLDLGLEWAGVGRTVWQVERDPFCRSVLERHWPNAARFDDVRTVGAHNLEPVDVICGGFPCQDISYAGKGLGLSGERSGLWYEFARIVGEMGPRFVVVENVAALITRGIGDVLGTLSDLGYDAQWRAIRASDVGAPHRRERIFIVAYARRWGVQLVGERGFVRGAASSDSGDGNQRERHGDAAGGSSEDLANANEHGPQGKRLCGILNGERATLGDHVDGCSRAESLGDSDRAQFDGSTGPGNNRERRPRVRPPGGRKESRGRGQTQPLMGRAAHGLPERLDRWPARPGEPQADWEAPRTVEKAANRAARLRALGNAVVPQVGAEIGKWLLKIARSVPQ